MTLTEDTARAEFERAADALPPCPPALTGRGVVIAGGGVRYFPCLWVCLCELRELGCVLPVELWHLGATELTPTMRALVEPLGVTCVDALAVPTDRPFRRVWDPLESTCRHASLSIL